MRFRIYLRRDLTKASLGLMALLLSVACSSPSSRQSPVLEQAPQDLFSATTPALSEQVIIAPLSESEDLKSEAGGALVAMTEAQKKDFFSSTTPVHEAVDHYRPLPPVEVVVYDESHPWTRRNRLWNTLTHAGLGAVIGHQFGGRSGRGAIIGGTLGWLRDAWIW